MSKQSQNSRVQSIEKAKKSRAQQLEDASFVGLKFDQNKSIMLRYEDKIERAAGKMPVQRVIDFMALTIARNPDLAKCTPGSIVSSLLRSLYMNLDITPEMGECYLIPRWNSKMKAEECTFMTGYRGYIAMATNTGELISLNSQVVREQDAFYVEYGLENKFRHVPELRKPRGSITHAYCLWHFKSGGQYFEFMDIAEIEGIKSKSPAASSEHSPWNVPEYYPDMCRKTVIRKSRKYIPISSAKIRAFVRNLEVDDEVHNLDDFKTGGRLDPAEFSLQDPEGEKGPKKPEPESKEDKFRDTASGDQKTKPVPEQEQGKVEPKDATKVPENIGDANAQPPDGQTKIV